MAGVKNRARKLNRSSIRAVKVSNPEKYLHSSRNRALNGQLLPPSKLDKPTPATLHGYRLLLRLPPARAIHPIGVLMEMLTLLPNGGRDLLSADLGKAKE